MAKRVIQVAKGLFFEYEVKIHRRIQERIDSVSANRSGGAQRAQEEQKETAEQASTGESPVECRLAKTGMHVPFKQVRLKGQVNPLKPPIHVETVLIGRAFGQPTGYLAGVGFRILDDGYVEGEFLQGVENFNSFEEFEKAVTSRLQRASDRIQQK